MQQHPLVSIVLCTYNGSVFLEEQLTTLIDQTWRNIEIVVCDDGSTDNTAAIIRSFADKDKRISFYSNESTLGLNKNFEKGCLLAKGDFIAICDQDDIWLINKIEQLVPLFTNNEVLLCHNQSVRFTESVPNHIKVNNKRNLFTGSDERKLFYFNTIAGHNIIFRKELLQYAVPFAPGIFYDWWLCMIAACYGNVGATNEVLTFHRHHQHNVTLGKKDEKKQSRAKAMERIHTANMFLHIKSMKPKSREFGTELSKNLAGLSDKKFSFKLFLFLLRNAPVIFFFKKSVFPFFSYLKISYRLSWAI